MPKAKGAVDMLQVARLYYREDRTKDAIARELKIDPRTVTSLLARAREAGIVDIRIREDALDLSLEDRLKRKYGHLDRVLTLPTLGPIETAEQHSELIRRFGVLAAQYFEDFMAEHHGPVHMAVSGGVTVFEAVDAIKEKTRPNLFIHVTAIVGYGMLSKEASHLVPAANASALWAKSGRLPGNHLCYATAGPLPVRLDNLIERPGVKPVLAEMEKINLVFAGLGVITPDKKSPPLRRDAPTLRNQLSITELLKPAISFRELQRAEVVGDFSYLLITANGGEAIVPGSDPPRPLRFFVTGGYDTADHAGLEFYRRLVRSKKKKVVVIAGPFKVEAIMAALRGKLFNVLITDEGTAQRILEESRP